MAFARNAAALGLAVLCTYVLAVIAASQSVLSRLEEMGVDVSVSQRISTTLADLSGMAALFVPLLLIGLALGFLVTALIVRRRPQLRLLGYTLAGFVAVVVMHVLLRMVLELTPVAAARTMGGLIVQGIAGAIGGYVFYLASSRRAAVRAAHE